MITHRALDQKIRRQGSGAEAEAIPTQSKPNRQRPPRLLPKAQATQARPGSGMLLCPANHRAYAPRTVQPSAPKRREIGFCSPPVFPLGLVYMKFVSAIAMPSAISSCVKRVSLALLTNGHQLPEELPLPASAEPQHGHKLDLAGALRKKYRL